MAKLTYEFGEGCQNRHGQANGRVREETGRGVF